MLEALWPHAGSEIDSISLRNRQITGVIWGVISGLIVHARGIMATCGIRDRLDLTEERQTTGVIWGVICGPMTIGKQARELCVYVCST